MNGIEAILYAVLAILVILVLVLIVVFFMLKKKEKNEIIEENKEIAETNIQTGKVSTTSKIAKEYETKSIFDFMEFETVKDNMIVQKGGKCFLMAIECKGVNYDLMSEVEKTATEQGFSTFLNTLREPIQIYIQTRTINLEKNIEGYKEKVNKIRDDIAQKEYKLKEYQSRTNINEKVLKNKNFELLRAKNLYSYGVDIVNDTKKMSLNKNVLKKKYYIIIRYYYDPVDRDEAEILSQDEIRETAFSALYTKAVAMISVLSGIGIVGKTLNSFELVELLYNAYNRDDSEVFGIEKALEAGYDELYVNSQSIIDKKIAALNKEIEIRAQKEAQNAVNKVMDERNQELEEIEDNIDSIIEELARKIIEEENNIPKDIKEKAVEEIQKKGEKKSNGKQETSRRRRVG